MSYNLLSEPVRRFIRDKGWEQLRPIQAAAAERILTTDNHYILASRTASGKTEAAFLPIVSKINFQEPGVQVLYISPLIALINDQFMRIEELCRYLDVKVTKWHGEASRSQKEHLIKEPTGIVLITPESMEAMFANKPFQVQRLFSQLKYVVIDEIHSFLGTERGVQLKSLLSRLKMMTGQSFRIVGLSATIGDYEVAKKFTGDPEHTKVLLDRTAKEIVAVFRYFKAEGDILPLELLEDLYEETKEDKVLIFPNSRGRAEEVAVGLKKMAERNKNHLNYFSHHSSVDKQLREYVEHFAKTNQRQNFCISCTSTLELGIDIGSVDEVVQIDAAHSIASLVQRIGRSGRKEGKPSMLFQYATKPWSLLQSVAGWLLYKEGFIEPPQDLSMAWDILLHQLLSLVKGTNGISLADLCTRLQQNAAFLLITKEDIISIIDHLLNLDLLESVGGELIIGIEGERIVNGKDFYTVFKSEENYKVHYGLNRIGEIPFSLQLKEGENIILSAKVWRIKDVDHKTKKVAVVPANDGRKPIFNGGVGSVHPAIRQKMFEVLFTEEEYEFAENSAMDCLKEMRKEWEEVSLTDLKNERPLRAREEGKLELYTFTGSSINRTLQLLLKINGLNSLLDDASSCILIEAEKDAFFEVWSNLLDSLGEIDRILSELLEANPDAYSFSKWGIFLPTKLKTVLIKSRYFDSDGTEAFLRNIKLFELKY